MLIYLGSDYTITEVSFMINRIGVLTSGGDAPGMNATLRAIVRAGIKNGKEMFVIYDGYRGLVEGQIQKVDRTFVSDIITRGGTIIRSARLEEFKEEETRKRAVKQLENHGIDALVVIGGDGTFMGAKKLSNLGINCIAIPATIDNDIASTDYTVGFDTALNTICDAVAKLRDTSSSHQRCSIIEVMGRYCGDLAVSAGIACGADLIISSDHPLSRGEVIERIKVMRQEAKRHIIVIVTEKLCDVHELAHDVETETGYECRAEVLGRVQRGGSPSAFDRVLAAKFGSFAVDLLLQDKSGRCVGIRNNELIDYDIEHALKMERNIHNNLIRIISILN